MYSFPPDIGGTYMGKPDVMMQSYLCDKERFADLFNGVFF